MFRALCSHHQEVKIVLFSAWYHNSCRWPSGSQVERGLIKICILLFLIVRNIQEVWTLMCDNIGIFWNKSTSQDEEYYFNYVLGAPDREVFVLALWLCERSYRGIGIIMLDFSVVFVEMLGMRYAKRTQTETRWCHHKDLITLRAIKRAS